MSKKFQNRFLFRGKIRTQLSAIKVSLIGLIVILTIIYAVIFLVPVVPGHPNTQTPDIYQIKIKPQSGLTSIATQLSEQGLMVAPNLFKFGSISILVAGKLKPGTYKLPLGASLGKVLLQIARGDRIRETIAIIPGMTIWQIRSLIDSHPALLHDTKGMSNHELIQSLNISFPSPEGLLFPDNYIFDPDESDINIYRRALQAMQKQVTAAWERRNNQLPLKNPYELIILASIVEKETGRSADRDMVAAVFTNRLKQGMLLQTDPTVIYGIGSKFDGNLKRADLRRDSPYNSYMRKGLPPTPIAMPSKESLLAAAHPAESSALYFVAKGDGGSFFSKSLSEHQAAVDQFQRRPAQKKTAQ